jgi:hypothetical protein
LAGSPETYHQAGLRWGTATSNPTKIGTRSAAQLARYLGEYSPAPDADDAADDPCAVTRAHVEAFQAWMVETRSAS